MSIFQFWKKEFSEKNKNFEEYFFNLGEKKSVTI